MTFLAGFEVNIANLYAAQFADTHSGIKQKPQHLAMLNIISLIDDLVTAFSVPPGMLIYDLNGDDEMDEYEASLPKHGKLS